MRQILIKHFVTFTRLITYFKRDHISTSHWSPLAKKFFFLAAFIAILIMPLIVCLPVQSKVIRLDEVDLSGKHYAYLYQWSNPEIKPKAIVIAIHGLIMHGLAYEHLAHHLANEGVLVLAPDLPGYGRRWHKDQISYLSAQENLADIIQSAKNTYKNLPIICLGESLGANLALSVSEAKPELVDGLILSSPALKRRINVSPKIVIGSINMLVSFLKTDTEVDLSPYMRSYASEDPIVIQTMFNDPLIHRQLKCQALWDSCAAMDNVFKQARLVNKTTPILIMQGSQDRILKAAAIIKLVSSLNSKDQTVKWFNDRGHTLLEECQPKPDVLQTIDDWFKTHIDKPLIEAKTNISQPVTSSLPPLSEALLNSVSHSD